MSRSLMLSPSMVMTDLLPSICTLKLNVAFTSFVFELNNDPHGFRAVMQSCEENPGRPFFEVSKS